MHLLQPRRAAMSNRMFLVSFIALVSACSSGPALTPIPDSFDVAVGETAEELDQHLDSLRAATTMDDVMDEAARHGQTADDLQVALRGYIMACPKAQGLIALVNGLEATERGHQTALAGSATPAEARSRANAYGRGFSELLGKLSYGWDAAGCR